MISFGCANLPLRNDVFSQIKKSNGDQNELKIKDSQINYDSSAPIHNLKAYSLPKFPYLHLTKEATPNKFKSTENVEHRISSSLKGLDFQNEEEDILNLKK